MNVKPHTQRIKSEDSDVPIILVVEDDEDNLLFISHAWIFLKYNFITTNKGKEALELATKYEIDLVLIDLILSDINGFEIIKFLKQNNLTKDIPIIVISALVEAKNIKKALDSGCDDYLTKPYFIEELEGKIKSYLSQSFFRTIHQYIRGLVSPKPPYKNKLSCRFLTSISRSS